MTTIFISFYCRNSISSKGQYSYLEATKKVANLGHLLIALAQDPIQD